MIAVVLVAGGFLALFATFCLWLDHPEIAGLVTLVTLALGILVWWGFFIPFGFLLLGNLFAENEL